MPYDVAQPKLTSGNVNPLQKKQMFQQTNDAFVNIYVVTSLTTSPY